jgi:hypothetical protein
MRDWKHSAAGHAARDRRHVLFRNAALDEALRILRGEIRATRSP